MRLVYWHGATICEKARGNRATLEKVLKEWEPKDQAEFSRKFAAQIWTERDADRFRYLDGSHPLRDPRP